MRYFYSVDLAASYFVNRVRIVKILLGGSIKIYEQNAFQKPINLGGLRPELGGSRPELVRFNPPVISNPAFDHRNV